MFEKLSDVFIAAAEKYLTAVDAVPAKSNQHEIGGLKKAGLADHLGYPQNGSVISFTATMIYISADHEEPVICKDNLSWYDSRFNQAHRSAEYRLYYPTNAVSERFREGDYFLLALTTEHTLVAVFTPPGSSAELQLKSLFGAVGQKASDSLQALPLGASDLVLPVRLLLTELGIELYSAEKDDQRLLDKMLKKFKGEFPKTAKFSEFARKQLASNTCAKDDPDSLLLEWMGYEERLFRIMERYIVAETLKKGFGDSGHDVDEFIRFSLSVQNRRKSRVGHAFEHHITEILQLNKVKFEKGVCTEGKQKPDFLFPSHAAYHDHAFNSAKLFMLAAKTSCKDRWRQVLAEAAKIEYKHLLTLETAISEDQINQMTSMGIKLVVPSNLHDTFFNKISLINLKEFIETVS